MIRDIIAAIYLGAFCGIILGFSLFIGGVREVPAWTDTPITDDSFVEGKNSTGIVLDINDTQHVFRILNTAPKPSEAAMQMAANNPAIQLPRYQESWRNSETDIEYKMNVYTIPPMPIGGGDRCRNFSIESTLGNNTSSEMNGVACYLFGGMWLVRDVNETNTSLN